VRGLGGRDARHCGRRAGFLIAVLWFDLMFDVQARAPGETLPDEVLASISAYYRRVTTAARPMSRLIPLVMLATLGAVVAEIVAGGGRAWAPWLSLAAALAGMGLALVRTVPNAVRLGAAGDALQVRTRLVRGILADHLVSLAAMATLLALQLTT
jgi:hypothetical protein